MKKILFTLLALTLLFSVSCTKDTPEDIPENKEETVLTPVEQAREYIDNEEFEKAYELLLTLEGDEAEELLLRFSYLPEKYIEVDYGGITTTTTYSYDGNGNIVEKTVVSPSGERVTKYEYDEGGRLLSKVETHPSAHVEKVVNTYDEKGNLLTYAEYVDGRLDFKQEMRYDENSNLIYKAISGYIETVETREYNKNGLLTLTVIRNLKSGAEEKTVFVYDELDRLLKRTYTDQSENLYEVCYTYTDNGKIQTETDRGEIISIRFFDKGDRELYSAYPAHKTGLVRAEYEYNENGKIERRYQLTVNPLKELEETETVWKYADADNLYKIPEDSLYSETTTTAEGDIYTEVYTYDENGKLKMIEGKKNGEWQYSRMYSYGNLINNRSEDYDYRFTYDNKGNLLKREDAMSSYSEEYENYKLYYNPNKL